MQDAAPFFSMVGIQLALFSKASPFQSGKQIEDIHRRDTYQLRLKAQLEETLLYLNILPKLDRVFERSIIALLLGLFRTDLLAREMSAVTLVIDIL